MSQNSVKRGSNSLILHLNLWAVMIIVSRTRHHHAYRAIFCVVSYFRSLTGSHNRVTLPVEINKRLIIMIMCVINQGDCGRLGLLFLLIGYRLKMCHITWFACFVLLCNTYKNNIREKFITKARCPSLVYNKGSKHRGCCVS